jgi:DNA-binding PadR family transcriptional regulator
MFYDQQRTTMHHHHHSNHRGERGQGRRFMRHHGGGRHGFADIEGGGRGFHAGRKLGSSGLQLIILALLEDKPRHGYEIIKALEERSGGYYAPSPGMVYPALTYLEEIGQAEIEAEGAKKLYRITPTGKAELDKRRPESEEMLAQLQRIGAKMERVRRVFAGEDSPDDEAGSAELRAARLSLKSALRDKRGASRDEQQRITAILNRAAKEIGAAEKK